MARWLRQSTSVDVPIGPFLDATDGITAETGLTITQPDIRLKKNGGAWAQKNAAQTLSHEENGYYEVTLDATDTNTLGLLRLAVAESGALPIWEDFLVVPSNVWDSFFASDLLDVNVSQYGGSNGTFSGGRPEVNTTHAAGTAWGSGAITAASIAADAITAAKIADNAIDAGAIATGAITAAKFAAGAIDAAAVAADAGTEIATAVWASASRSLTVLDEDSTTLDLDATIRGAVGLASANLDTQLGAIDDLVDTEVAAIKTVVDAIEVDTQDIQGRLPAALVSGRMDSNMQAAAAGVITASVVATGAIDADALASDAVNEIADGVLDRNMATGTDSGSTTVRTPRQALRALRNKVSIAAGTATVCKEDDTTSSWTAAVTTAAGDPISAIDPAGP